MFVVHFVSLNTWHVEVGLLLDRFLLWIGLPEICIGWVGRLLLLFQLLSSWLVGQLVDPVGLKVLQQPLTTTEGPAQSTVGIFAVFHYHQGCTFHTQSTGKDVHQCGLACGVLDVLSGQIASHNLNTRCIISLFH